MDRCSTKKNVNMEITGVDFILYSNRSIFEVQTKIIESFKNFWGKDLVIEESERIDNQRLELFFARNKQMNDEHSKIGFTLNDQGESCILLIVDFKKNANLGISVDRSYNSTINVGDEGNEGRLIVDELWSYTLVLPDNPDTDIFSKIIYQFVLNALC